jgi:hypothetical protein
MLRFFYVEDRTLKRQKSIAVFVVYIDTGSSMPISPSKSRDLADEKNKILTKWKWFETTVLYNIGDEDIKWRFEHAVNSKILWVVFI